MREIKFRAWDKEKGIMVYNDENDSSEYFDGVCISDIEMVNSRFKNTKDKYIWEQFTGLKDKNGVDIYDGDIIEVVGPHCLNGEQWHCESVSQNSYNIGEKLVVLNSNVGIRCRNMEDYNRNKDKDLYELAPNGKYGKSPVTQYELWNNQRSVKVIGNIHKTN